MLEMKNHKICKKVLGQYSRRLLSKEILHHDRYLLINDFRKEVLEKRLFVTPISSRNQ